MSSNFLNDENKGDIIIYQSESGETKIDVRFQDETVWLTQAQLCELYQSSKANVSEHIKNIFEEGELEQSAVVRKIRTTAAGQAPAQGERRRGEFRIIKKTPS